MDEVTGIEGAILEDLTVEPETLELLITRLADLTVSISEGEFLMTAAVREAEREQC